MAQPNANIHAETEEFLEGARNVFQFLEEWTAAIPAAEGLQGARRQAFLHTLAQTRQHAEQLQQVHVQARDLVRMGEESPPMTRVFGGDLTVNAVQELPPPRVYRLENFEGNYNEPTKCLDWLARAMNTARELRLDPQCVRSFLQRHCVGEAGTFVRDAVDLGQDVHGIIRTLEVQFAGLQDPISAARECQNVVRREEETMAQFCSRIKYLANMACRCKPNPAEAAATLAMDTFLTVSGIAVRQHVRQKNDMRLATGRPPLGWGEAVMLASQFEAERKAMIRQQKLQRQAAPRNGSAMYWVSEGSPAIDGNEDTNSLEEIECVEGEEPTVNYLRDPNRERRPFYRGRGTPRGSYRPNYQRGNGRPPPAPRPTEQHPGGAGYRPRASWVQNAETPAQDIRYIDEEIGENILYLNDGKGNVRRIDIKTLGVSPGECCKCGKPGHSAFGNDSHLCSLRQQPLTSKCVKCQKGGHHPSICPNVNEVPKN